MHQSPEVQFFKYRQFRETDLTLFFCIITVMLEKDGVKGWLWI